MSEPSPYTKRIRTGIPGLDEVLGGGLPEHGLYLLQGNPGVGKTTFALQFLLEAVRQGEPALYVAFSETRAELTALGHAHEWAVDQLILHDVSSTELRADRESEQTMFHPAEVELDETLQPIFTAIERGKPCRVVIDSVSEIRLIANDPLRYRRQLLALKRFFVAHQCTVLLIDDKVSARNDDVVQTLVHGTFALEKTTPAYGTTRRRLAVDKLRGVRFREGYHDYLIRTGGLEIFPRLQASDHVQVAQEDSAQSGVPELDEMLGGGLARSASTLFMGAAGTGKSSLAAQYAIAAAKRGEKAVIFSFEESFQTWLGRSNSLGLDPQPCLDSGTLKVIQIDPAELTPGELSTKARRLVDEGFRLVVIDSLNGYLQSVPEESFLLLHLHELLTYLGQQGVTTLMVLAQAGMLGPTMQAPLDVSYLADAVVLLRYFEAQGEVRQAISVVKKRGGHHERTLREFKLGKGGVQLGPPLTDFHGVLTGVPTYVGSGEPLMRGNRRDG